MNANELAKLLEVDSWRQQAEQIENLKQWERRHLDVIEKQQAEIQALKQIIDANNLSQNIGQFVKAANEPVAWMDDLSFFTEQPDDMDGVTPLYTHQYERPHNTVLVPCDKLAEMQAEIETLKAHPVKELDEQFEKGFKAGKEEGWKAHKFHHPVKELTDEEINEIVWQQNLLLGNDDLRKFAKAILRKAQEK